MLGPVSDESRMSSTRPSSLCLYWKGFSVSLVLRLSPELGPRSSRVSGKRSGY